MSKTRPKLLEKTDVISLSNILYTLQFWVASDDGTAFTRSPITTLASKSEVGTWGFDIVLFY